MNLDELNFDLRRSLIAQRPLAQRDDSRMMLSIAPPANGKTANFANFQIFSAATNS